MTTADILRGAKPFSKIPKVADGIILGEKRKGFFSVVEPVDTTINHVANPSFMAGEYPYNEIDTEKPRAFNDGYTAVTSTLAHSDPPDCFPMHGGWCRVTPIVFGGGSVGEGAYGERAGMYYSLSLAGGDYTFSCFVAGSKSHKFLVYVTDNSGNVISSEKSLRGNNNWQRLHITFHLSAMTDCRLYLIRERTNINPTKKFYTSFWVCEDNGFLTLPFNGSYEEKEDSQSNAYSWRGIKWSSKSVRYDIAKNSGRERFLNEFGFSLNAINGLGVSGINHIIERTAIDGSVWNATKVNSREFTLSGQIYAKDMESRFVLESNLYSLLTSTASRESLQPTTMIFRVYNTENNDIIEGQTVYIYCRFVGGIATSIPNESGAYNVNLSFMMEDPYIYSSMEKEKNIITPLDSGGRISIGGFGDVWLENGENGKLEVPFDLLSGRVYGFVKGANKKVYIYGQNINIDGYSNQIAIEYDYETKIAQGIGGWDTYSGLNAAYGATALPDGRIAFVGSWEYTLGGVANTEFAAIYDPSDSSWSAIGGQFAGGAESAGAQIPRKVFVDKKGHYYFVGTFPVTNTAIYKWDGTNWTALGTFTGTNPYSLDSLYIPNTGSFFAEEEYIFIVGSFNSINSVPGTARCAKYAIGAGIFETLGGGGLDSSASKIVKHIDGYLYIAGTFTGTADGGVQSKNIIKHNFYNFIGIENFAGAYTDFLRAANPIEDMVSNPLTGELYVGVDFDPNKLEYPVILPSYLTISRDGVSPGKHFYLLIVSLVSLSGVVNLFFDEEEGVLWARVNVPVERLVDQGTRSFVYDDEDSIIYNNGENAYPKIIISGGGKLVDIYNHQTRKKIMFSEYQLGARETVTIDLQKYSSAPFQIVSSEFGNITRILDTSSNINFYFINGKNDLSSLFIRESTDSKILCKIRERYLLLPKSIEERNIV